MTDRVDEWALNYLHEFDGTPLQSVAKGAVQLGKLQDEAEKKAAEEAAEAFKPVLAKLKEALKDKAEDVRVTTRLVDSPACLVVQDDGMSTQLARMLKQAGQQAPETKPVLEVNAEHRWSRSWTAACTSTTWPTSCSTRPCWPKAACRRPRSLRQAGECLAGLITVKWLLALMDKALAAIELIVFWPRRCVMPRAFSARSGASVGLALLGYPPWWGLGFPKPVRGRAVAPALAGPVAATRQCNGRWLPHPRPWRRLPAGGSARPGWTKPKLPAVPPGHALGGAGLPIGGPGRLR